MNYQLVVQMIPDSSLGLEEMIGMEDRLIDLLGDMAEVDGHDIGAEEMNIFIVCNNPENVFNLVRVNLDTIGLPANVRIGFRALDEETFKVLHPIGLQSLVVS